MTLADAALFDYTSTDDAQPPAVVMSNGMGLDSSFMVTLHCCRRGP